MFNWKLWIRSLGAAAIGGAATAVANTITEPELLQKPTDLITFAGVGAAIGALGYLKTHPETPAEKAVKKVAKWVK